MTQHDFSIPEPDTPRREVANWLNGWLDRHLPSEWVGVLEDQDRAIALEFINEYRSSVEILEVGYTALAEAVDLVNFVPKDSWPEHRSVQYLLVAENVKSFRSAQNRLMRGYYQDCGAITRSLYEAFVRVLFVSLHPEDWSSIFAYPTPPGQRRFNLTALLRDELGLDWDPIYRLLSEASHSNIQSVRQKIIALSTPDEEIRRYGYRNEFDPVQVNVYLPVLDFVLWVHLRIIWDVILESRPGSLDEGSRVVEGVDVYLDRIKGSLFILTPYIRYKSSSLWSQAGHDVDLLIEMMQMADKGQGWRALLC